MWRPCTSEGHDNVNTLCLTDLIKCVGQEPDKVVFLKTGWREGGAKVGTGGAGVNTLLQSDRKKWRNEVSCIFFSYLVVWVYLPYLLWAPYLSGKLTITWGNKNDASSKYCAASHWCTSHSHRSPSSVPTCWRPAEVCRRKCHWGTHTHPHHAWSHWKR